MIRVGLTGGCGSGKSTVADMFSPLGVPVISADVIVHRLLSEDEEVTSAVVSLFGGGLLRTDGAIDRRALADIVFGDRQNLKRLTDILYPRVRAEVQSFFEEMGRQKKFPVAIAEVPLLIEGGALHLYDVIVVVSATYENQLKRFLKKGGTKADLDRRIRNQLDMAEKEKFADYVVNNNGSAEQTFEQVKEILGDLRGRAELLRHDSATFASDTLVGNNPHPKRNKSRR